jgi:hypothetical protein
MNKVIWHTGILLLSAHFIACSNMTKGNRYFRFTLIINKLCIFHVFTLQNKQ